MIHMNSAPPTAVARIASHMSRANGRKGVESFSNRFFSGSFFTVIVRPTLETKGRVKKFF